MSSKNGSYTDESDTTVAEQTDTAQTLQKAVDLAVGAGANVVDVVNDAIPTFRDPESRDLEIKRLREQLDRIRDPQTRDEELKVLREQVERTIVNGAEHRGGKIRRQVTEELNERTKDVRKRVEPAVRERVEPVYRDRVEPVYRDRVEPTVKKVRERL